jgi:hypothetical protein
MSEPAKDEAVIVEIMAKAHRERWRDREGVRAETLEWSDICGAEHLDSIALMEAALAAIRAAGWAVVPVAEQDAIRADNARLRGGWLRVIQSENSCPATGGGCFAKRCGCLAEMEMLANEAAPDPEVKP